MSGESGFPVSPLADLPAGTAFGTMVHTVLEEVDFGSDRLDVELEDAVDASASLAVGGSEPGGPGRVL